MKAAQWTYFSSACVITSLMRSGELLTEGFRSTTWIRGFTISKVLQLMEITISELEINNVSTETVVTLPTRKIIIKDTVGLTSTHTETANIDICHKVAQIHLFGTCSFIACKKYGGNLHFHTFDFILDCNPLCPCTVLYTVHLCNFSDLSLSCTFVAHEILQICLYRSTHLKF